MLSSSVDGQLEGKFILDKVVEYQTRGHKKHMKMRAPFRIGWRVALTRCTCHSSKMTT